MYQKLNTEKKSMHMEYIYFKVLKFGIWLNMSVLH